MKRKRERPAAKPGGEGALALAGLMHTHRDAAAFYKVAAERLGHPVFAALKARHEEAVGLLWARLQTLGPPDFLEGADTDAREFFSPLARLLGTGRSQAALAARLAAAEKQCRAAVEEALGGAQGRSGLLQALRALQTETDSLLARDFSGAGGQ